MCTFVLAGTLAVYDCRFGLSGAVLKASNLQDPKDEERQIIRSHLCEAPEDLSSEGSCMAELVVLLG